jgi:hypothetical protein
MMYDILARFAENFDCDLEASTNLLTSQYDLGAANVDIGDGQPVYLVVVVEETFTDGGDSATLELRLVSDDTASIHASTSTMHLSTGTFLKAALVAGNVMFWQLPHGNVAKPYERYLGINAVVATAGFDAGEITVFLSLTPPTNIRSYPDAL